MQYSWKQSVFQRILHNVDLENHKHNQMERKSYKKYVIPKFDGNLVCFTELLNNCFEHEVNKFQGKLSSYDKSEKVVIDPRRLLSKISNMKQGFVCV